MLSGISLRMVRPDPSAGSTTEAMLRKYHWYDDDTVDVTTAMSDFASPDS